MRAAWHPGRRIRLWVLLLLLPAVLCRVLVPPGFMPGTATGAGPTIQMCHGAGPLPSSSRAPGAPGTEVPGKPGPHHSTPCVFAASGTAAPPSFIVPVLAGPAEPCALPTPPEAVVPLRAQHHPHSARAPPGNAQPA